MPHHPLPKQFQEQASLAKFVHSMNNRVWGQHVEAAFSLLDHVALLYVATYTYLRVALKNRPQKLPVISIVVPFLAYFYIL